MSTVWNNYFVVRSRSNQHPEKGYAFGQQIYLDENTAKKAVERSEFHDLYIVPEPLDKIIRYGISSVAEVNKRIA